MRDFLEKTGATAVILLLTPLFVLIWWAAGDSPWKTIREIGAAIREIWSLET